MPRPLKVYGARGFRSDCREAANRSRQTREVIAARSKAEAKRLAGWRWGNDWFGETGNADEVRIALTRPGKLFWKPLDAHNSEFRELGLPVNHALPYCPASPSALGIDGCGEGVSYGSKLYFYRKHADIPRADRVVLVKYEGGFNHGVTAHDVEYLALAWVGPHFEVVARSELRKDVLHLVGLPLAQAREKVKLAEAARIQLFNAWIEAHRDLEL